MNNITEDQRQAAMMTDKNVTASKKKLNLTPPASTPQTYSAHKS
jgi:hypothetical protein